jgi:hypothetical protein
MNALLLSNARKFYEPVFFFSVRHKDVAVGVSGFDKPRYDSYSGTVIQYISIVEEKKVTYLKHSCVE